MINRDSPHCIWYDLTEIAPCFELILLQTVELYRGEQSGSIVKLRQTVPIFHKQTEEVERLTAELE